MLEGKPEIEFEHDDFEFETLEEEVRVDGICRSLLKYFFNHLIARGVAPEKASEYAYSADYYLRDYVLDFRRDNALRPQPGIVVKFAANWYIIKAADPETGALERHLEGIAAFYRFLKSRRLIGADELAFLEEECGRIEYYRQRIESFNTITGAGYVEWEQECPLDRSADNT